MASPLNRYLRAFGPSVVLAAGSALAFLKLRSAAQTPLVAPLLEAMAWVPMVAYMFATGWAATSAIRLWRWETGSGPICPHCGGGSRAWYGQDGTGARTFGRALTAGAMLPPGNRTVAGVRLLHGDP